MMSFVNVVVMVYIDIARKPRLEAFALNLADPAKISTKVNLSGFVE